VVAGESGEAGNPGTLGGCDFFIFRCSLLLESSQEHLPASIAEVLRLRATKPSVCDSSAKRFAQDDGFVGGLEIQVVGYAENTKRSKKSQALGMTKRRGSLQGKEWLLNRGIFQIEVFSRGHLCRAPLLGSNNPPCPMSPW
jgi:hypothetical protein